MVDEQDSCLRIKPPKDYDIELHNEYYRVFTCTWVLLF